MYIYIWLCHYVALLITTLQHTSTHFHILQHTLQHTCRCLINTYLKKTHLKKGNRRKEQEWGGKLRDLRDLSHKKIHSTSASGEIRSGYTNGANDYYYIATHFKTLHHTAVLDKCIFQRGRDVKNESVEVTRWVYTPSSMWIVSCVATRANALQHSATHCNALQYTERHCNPVQHTATRCKALQHTATHYNTVE